MDKEEVLFRTAAQLLGCDVADIKNVVVRDDELIVMRVGGQKDHFPEAKAREIARGIQNASGRGAAMDAGEGQVAADVALEREPAKPAVRPGKERSHK